MRSATVLVMRRATVLMMRRAPGADFAGSWCRCLGWRRCLGCRRWSSSRTRASWVGSRARSATRSALFPFAATWSPVLQHGALGCNTVQRKYSRAQRATESALFSAAGLFAPLTCAVRTRISHYSHQYRQAGPRAGDRAGLSSPAAARTSSLTAAQGTDGVCPPRFSLAATPSLQPPSRACAPMRRYLKQVVGGAVALATLALAKIVLVLIASPSSRVLARALDGCGGSCHAPIVMFIVFLALDSAIVRPARRWYRCTHAETFAAASFRSETHCAAPRRWRCSSAQTPTFRWSCALLRSSLCTSSVRMLTHARILAHARAHSGTHTHALSAHFLHRLFVPSGMVSHSMISIPPGVACRACAVTEQARASFTYWSIPRRGSPT
jgi:hypothetical protein